MHYLHDQPRFRVPGKYRVQAHHPQYMPGSPGYRSQLSVEQAVRPLLPSAQDSYSDPFHFRQKYCMHLPDRFADYRQWFRVRQIYYKVYLFDDLLPHYRLLQGNKIFQAHQLVVQTVRLPVY
jgi:hypothetical protein